MKKEINELLEKHGLTLIRRHKLTGYSSDPYRNGGCRAESTGWTIVRPPELGVGYATALKDCSDQNEILRYLRTIPLGEPTPAMLNVLRWLFKHPCLRIAWTKTKTDRPHFTEWRASESARQHMIGVCKDLLDDHEIEKRATARMGRNDGGTPDL